MKPSYFREQKHYSFFEIQKKLNVSEDKCKQLLGVLKKYGVIKSVDRNKPEYEDLSDMDVVLADVSDNAQIAYKFCFVGVILVENSVFCCYPKYIDDNDSPKAELKQILEVIRKYDSQEQLVYLYNGTDENKVFNRMAVSLYLLHDYFANGIYTNQKTIIETNGEGEIDWDRTINETFALIKNNTPYYVDLQTINTQSNELDYFKLLHECILTMCSNELKEAGLLDLFDLTEVELSKQKLKDFGDIDYIKYRLEKEIQVQYVTKKQILLKTLYTFISEISADETSNSLSLYGTNTFNLVWEKACGVIFNDRKDDYKIEFAKWHLNNNEYFPQETLIPDIISVDKGNNTFAILDAKYYLIDCTGKRIQNQPGTQDLVKQFAYNKVLYDKIWSDGFEKIINAFLIPRKTSKKDTDDFKILGCVKYRAMQNINTDILADIQVIELSPEFVFKKYLSGMQCTECLTEVKTAFVKPNIYQSNYEIQNGRGSYQCPKELIAVGYLKSDYFNAVEANKKAFCFYFYQRKDWVIYPLHDDLPFCDKFIGIAQLENKTKMILGNITGGLHILSLDETRKKVKELQPDLSDDILPKSAQFYYLFLVEDIEIKDYDSMVEEKINKYHGNNILHKYSPKVIQWIT